MTHQKDETADALRDLLAKATPGPWRARHDLDWGVSSVVSASHVRPIIADVPRSTLAHVDAALIVAAVNALPDLLAALSDHDAMRRRVEAPWVDADVAAIASAIHDARYTNGRASSHWEPFEQESEAGRIYCTRLANAAILAALDTTGGADHA